MLVTSGRKRVTVRLGSALLNPGVEFPPAACPRVGVPLVARPGLTLELGCGGSARYRQTGAGEAPQQQIDDLRLVDTYLQQTARIGPPGRLQLEQTVERLLRLRLVAGVARRDRLREEAERIPVGDDLLGVEGGLLGVAENIAAEEEVELVPGRTHAAGFAGPPQHRHTAPDLTRHDQTATVFGDGQEIVPVERHRFVAEYGGRLIMTGEVGRAYCTTNSI